MTRRPLAWPGSAACYSEDGPVTRQAGGLCYGQRGRDNGMILESSRANAAVVGRVERRKLHATKWIFGDCTERKTCLGENQFDFVRSSVLMTTHTSIHTHNDRMRSCRRNDDSDSAMVKALPGASLLTAPRNLPSPADFVGCNETFRCIAPSITAK